MTRRKHFLLTISLKNQTKSTTKSTLRRGKDLQSTLQETVKEITIISNFILKLLYLYLKSKSLGNKFTELGWLRTAFLLTGHQLLSKFIMIS